MSGGGGLWIYGRAELRVCALGVRIHLAHGRESVFRCIPLYLVLYRVGTLYLDAMPRIRLYLHRTCCILIVSDGFLTRAPRYIRNTSKYSGIHQDTVLIENPPTFDRNPPPTRLRRDGRGGGSDGLRGRIFGATARSVCVLRPRWRPRCAAGGGRSDLLFNTFFGEIDKS